MNTAIVPIDPKRSVELAPSILDDQYAISLRRAVDHERDSSEGIIRKAIEVIADIHGAKDELARKPESHYVVDMTPEQQEQLQKGLLKLDCKDGQIFAQFRDSKGHYGKKLPIKEELIENGVDPLELKMAMQMAAIQQRLDQIAETLDEISESVGEVIKGQQNDRIGLYFAGMNLFLEAQAIQDESLRKLVSAQALKSLSDSIGQMTQALQEDIRYLVDGEYRKKKGARREAITSKMASIENCFEVIHRATILKAKIYFDAGEPAAFMQVADEYARFIGRAIAPYSGRLAELDSSDTLLTDGKWESRSRALAGTEDFGRMLSSGTTFYLDAVHDADEVVEQDGID